MGSNPNFYDDGSVTLRIVLPLSLAAKLSTYRREMHPDLTDAQVVEYLVRDDMERLGYLELPEGNRGKAAGRK